ncbi:MAG: hypothetical protein ACE15D_14450 [Candidatus Eisenbacteria bacterium]|nr:hypothetical protein [Candidatus Eisenbacteria bacterium]
MKLIVKASLLLAALGLLALPGIAVAQYEQDFDGLFGSPSGEILTGQDDYYLPSGSVDFKVYTYDGNALGIVQNPEGGSQFIAGTGPGDGTNYARAERNVYIGLGRWEIIYDFLGIFIGTPPGYNNVGSFSLRQASANTVHINLLTWVDPNNPVAINSTYVVYDAGGTQVPVPGYLPGPEWGNLQPNHWYRGRTVVDLDLNQIVEVGIRDLSGGDEAVYIPSGWYLIGGAGGFNPPDGFRFFGGGGGPGNSTAWDNTYIREEIVVQEGACCLADGQCTITTEEACDGEYMGDGVDCDPNPCEPSAVQYSTWGAIKSTFR